MQGACAGSAVAVDLSAADPGPFQRSAGDSRGAWAFGADAPGRPVGWSGFLPAGAADASVWITFPVSFSSTGYGHPVLAHVELTFLRSYEGRVDATVSLNASGCSPLSLAVREGQLVGAWARRVTTPFTMTIGARDVPALERGDGFEELALNPGCALAARVPYALTIALRHPTRAAQGAATAKIASGAQAASAGKFKLLGIRTCSLFSQQQRQPPMPVSALY